MKVGKNQFLGIVADVLGFDFDHVDAMHRAIVPMLPEGWDSLDYGAMLVAGLCVRECGLDAVYAGADQAPLERAILRKHIAANGLMTDDKIGELLDMSPRSLARTALAIGSNLTISVKGGSNIHVQCNVSRDSIRKIAEVLA